MKSLLLSTRSGKLTAEAGGDSAVLRTGEPVFVPDPTDRWHSAVAPAIRIHRLGTAVKAAKAKAYYNEIGAVHLLLPADDGIADGLPPMALDRALSPGKWLNTDDAADHRYTLTAERHDINSDSACQQKQTSFTLCELGVDEAIERLSRHMTFRTGDILVFGDAAISFDPPQLDTAIDAGIDGNPSLSIRIK